MGKTLKPGCLALGENNPKLNIWHGRYNGNVYDVLDEGFFKAYFKMLEPGDIIYLVVEDKVLDLVMLMVTANNSTPEDVFPKDDFVKVRLITSTAKQTEIDLKALKQQIKSEIVRQYGLKKVEENVE